MWKKAERGRQCPGTKPARWVTESRARSKLKGYGEQWTYLRINHPLRSSRHFPSRIRPRIPGATADPQCVLFTSVPLFCSAVFSWNIWIAFSWKLSTKPKKLFSVLCFMERFCTPVLWGAPFLPFKTLARSYIGISAFHSQGTGFGLFTCWWHLWLVSFLSSLALTLGSCSSLLMWTVPFTSYSSFYQQGLLASAKL